MLGFHGVKRNMCFFFSASSHWRLGFSIQNEINMHDTSTLLSPNDENFYIYFPLDMGPASTKVEAPNVLIDVGKSLEIKEILSK